MKEKSSFFPWKRKKIKVKRERKTIHAADRKKMPQNKEI